MTQADGLDQPWQVHAGDRLAEAAVWEEFSRLVADALNDAALLRPGPETRERVRQLAREVVQRYQWAAAYDGTQGILDPAGMEQRLVERTLGRGYLAGLLADPSVTDITVNGRRVLVERAGRKQLVEDLAPSDEESLRLLKRLAGPAGEHLDENKTQVELQLEGGARLKAIIPPQGRRVYISVRKHTLPYRNLEALVEIGALSASAAAFLDAAMRAGLSILVSGRTGSGKTTALQSLLASTHPDCRVCSLEEIAELDLDGLTDAVQLYTRQGNAQDVGRRRVRDLVRDVLVMYPDLLVLGECRGPEAMDALLAMGTGHVGLMSIHGRSPRAALGQLATFAQMAEEGVPRSAILEMIAEHVQLVVHATFVPGATLRRRRISHIFEVTGLGRQGRFEGQDLWLVDPDTDELSWTGIRPRCLEQLREAGVRYRLPAPPTSPRLLLRTNGHAAEAST
jgi:pilus assembly protein CpaF